MQPEQERASIPEIIGAWLHIWTPPRDTYVPPIPWRKLAIGAGIVAVVIGAALAVMVPRINHVQRPQRGEAADLLPAAGADSTAQEAARADLLQHIEGVVMADARERSASGELRAIEGPTTCEHTRGRPTIPVGVYDCFTVAKSFKSGKNTRSGMTGYPWRVVVDFRVFAYTWCRVEQIPGELMIQDPTQTIHLPDVCQGPRS